MLLRQAVDAPVAVPRAQHDDDDVRLRRDERVSALAVERVSRVLPGARRERVHPVELELQLLQTLSVSANTSTSTPGLNSALIGGPVTLSPAASSSVCSSRVTRASCSG